MAPDAHARHVVDVAARGAGASGSSSARCSSTTPPLRPDGTRRSTRSWTATTPRAQRLFDHASTARTAAAQVLGADAARLTTLVLLIIWTWRSAHNARGARADRRPAGAGMGDRRVAHPARRLGAAYIVVSDLWRSSDPASAHGEGWRTLAGVGLVRIVWWSPTSAASCCSAARSAWRSSGVTGRSAQTRALLVAATLVGAAGAFLLGIVRGAQDHRAPGGAAGGRSRRRPHARWRASTHAAHAPPTGPAGTTDPGAPVRPPVLGRHRVDRAREPRRGGVRPRRSPRPTGTPTRPGASTGATGPATSGPST